MIEYGDASSQKLAQRFQSALAEGNQAVRNEAAENLQAAIHGREGWDKIGVGYYGFHEEGELRRLLEAAVDDGKVTSPAVVNEIKESRAEVERMVTEFMSGLKASLSDALLPPPKPPAPGPA